MARGSTRSGRLPTSCFPPLTIRSQIRKLRIAADSEDGEAGTQLFTSVCKVTAEWHCFATVLGREAVFS
jgi:hypothetical protein